MSDSPTIDDLIQEVLRAAQAQTGDGISDELRDNLNSLGQHSERREARLVIASKLSGLTSPVGAGLLAIWLGAGVENGISPEPTAMPIVEAMLRWSRSIPVREDQDVVNGEPPSDTIIGMERLGQGLVTHLARSSQQRFEITERPEIIAELERVEHISAGAMWVLEVLRKCSGRLVVIHAESRKGVLVRYENISNCFHLFTLLQGVLVKVMPDARRPSPQTLAVACGEQNEIAHDHAWWHYGRGDVPEANFSGSVWGEASPLSIPRIYGEQVLLLWRPILGSREWDGNFFGPFLMEAPPSGVDQRIIP